jgi:DME family drug/metabolite transporter
MSQYAKGVVLVMVAGLLWSFIGLVVRHIEEAGTLAVVFWRSAGLLPVIALYMAWQGGGFANRFRAMGWAGLIAGLGITTAYLGAIYALQRTTVANAVFLYSTAPFFTAILARIALGERVRPVTWGAMALAGLGIYVMIGGEVSAQGAWAGNLAALASAFGFAVFAVALRSGRVSDMMPANLGGAVISMVAAALLAPALGQSMAINGTDLLLAFGMGVVILGGGMMAFTFGSRHLPAAEMTLLSGIENVLAPIWVWAILGESVGKGTLIGGAMVMAAVTANALIAARDDRTS